MHLVRNVSRLSLSTTALINANYTRRVQIASHWLALELRRPVTTYNDAGPRKNRPPNKEERLAAAEAKKRALEQSRLLAAIQNQTTLTPDKWRQEYTVTPSNSRILYLLDILKMLKPPINSLETAKNLLKAFDIERNVVIDGHLLELYAKQYREGGLTAADEKEVLEICDAIIAQEMHALPDLQPKIVMGLCITSQWKRALSLPHVKVAEPANNILATKSIRSNELDVTWSIFDRMLAADQTVAPAVMRTFIGLCGSNKDVLNEHLPRMMGYWQSFRVLIAENPAEKFKLSLERAGKEVQFTEIDYSGKCNACQQSLQSVTVSDDELMGLKANFLKRAIKGRSIFENTTAAEWQAFETCIKENGPFDMVVDGLNVAFCANDPQKKGRRPPSIDKLAATIDQLSETKKRILVIGRKHMTRWPGKGLDSIRSKATLFFVDNISKDDLFLLYAAMANETNSCDILSNDFMRQHHALTSYKYRDIFERWLQQHWFGFRFDVANKLIIFQPKAFRNYCHEYNGRWHMPILTNEELAEGINWHETKKNWACIKL